MAKSAVSKYKRTPKGWAANKRYPQSAKGKAAAASTKAKARNARYKRSEKGRAAQAKARARLREKRRNAPP
jgi:hypothetical protein